MKTGIPTRIKIGPVFNTNTVLLNIYLKEDNHYFIADDKSTIFTANSKNFRYEKDIKYIELNYRVVHNFLITLKQYTNAYLTNKVK